MNNYKIIFLFFVFLFYYLHTTNTCAESINHMRYDVYGCVLAKNEGTEIINECGGSTYEGSSWLTAGRTYTDGNKEWKGVLRSYSYKTADKNIVSITVDAYTNEYVADSYNSFVYIRPKIKCMHGWSCQDTSYAGQGGTFYLDNPMYLNIQYNYTINMTDQYTYKNTIQIGLFWYIREVTDNGENVISSNSMEINKAGETSYLENIYSYDPIYLEGGHNYRIYMRAYGNGYAFKGDSIYGKIELTASLSPVPIPESLSLFGLGLLCIIIFIHRKENITKGI